MAAAHSATLSWQEVSTGDPAVSYIINRALVTTGATGAYAQVGTSTTTGYVDTTVVAGLSYAYTVEAVNAAGDSAPCLEVTVTIPVSLPAVPTGLSIVVA